MLVLGCSDRPLQIEGSSEVPDGAGVHLDADMGGPVDLASAPRDLLGRSDLASADLSTFDAEPDLVATDLGCYGSVAPPQSSPLFAGLTTLTIPSGYTGESVAIGDVTGDGRADVVVGAWKSGGAPQGDLVIVFAQTATGQLAAAATYATGTQGILTPRSVDVGDVNGDGRLDVVVTRDSDVAVLTQSSNGTLNQAVALAGGSAKYGAEVVAVADLNGDGRNDVVAAGLSSADVYVWFQTSTGTLGQAETFPCTQGGYTKIVIGDLDNDGLLDAVFSAEGAPDACVLLQRTGGFAPALNVPLGKTATGIAVGDVNGDCHADLVFTTGGNRPDSQLGVALQAGPAMLGVPTFIPSFDIPSDVAVVDIDGNRLPDVVVLHDGWSTVGVYRQSHTGMLAPEETYAFSYINWGPDRMAVGDVNGDGRPDIVAADAQLSILYHQ